MGGGAKIFTVLEAAGVDVVFEVEGVNGGGDLARKEIEGRGQMRGTAAAKADGQDVQAVQRTVADEELQGDAQDASIGPKR